jgi:hypothetical protein
VSVLKISSARLIASGPCRSGNTVSISWAGFQFNTTPPRSKTTGRKAGVPLLADPISACCSVELVTIGRDFSGSILGDSGRGTGAEDLGVGSLLLGEGGRSVFSGPQIYLLSCFRTFISNSIARIATRLSFSKMITTC